MASEHQEFTAMLCKVCGTDQGVRELEVSVKRYAYGSEYFPRTCRTRLCPTCEAKVDSKQIKLSLAPTANPAKGSADISK